MVENSEFRWLVMVDPLIREDPLPEVDIMVGEEEEEEDMVEVVATEDDVQGHILGLDHAPQLDAVDAILAADPVLAVAIIVAATVVAGPGHPEDPDHDPGLLVHHAHRSPVHVPHVPNLVLQ